MNHYWGEFLELIGTPFQQLPLIWGIVPLYFGLLLNELTSAKSNFKTAIATGFSFVWAALQWLYPYFKPHELSEPIPQSLPHFSVNLVVTLLVLGLGILALFSGLRRRYPKHCAFLGHTRFANYFMITIFPIQAGVLHWTWDYLVSIGFFALPAWLALHFGLMPFRK
jgi:hypothetical protein